MIPRVVTEPIGGGPLARLAQSGAAPSEWYPAPPVGADAWLRRAIAVRDDQLPPRDWLQALAPAFAARGAAADRLARAAGGNGIVVTSGQQPGLFGGPIYTWSKALSALALADLIESATGVPTAPVFWAATDDADFAEASVTTVAVPGGAETLRLERPGNAAEQRPMADVPLGDVSALLAGLERGAGSALFADALVTVREAYVPGATVGDAYVALLRAILEPMGVAVLDASHDAVRAAAFTHLRRALARADVVDRALATRTGEITARGYTPQVGLVDRLSLVFELGAKGKRRIPIAEADAVDRRSAPGTLSPNVLLRPIVERALLPTAAYVAGPGELAYFAQVSAVAMALDLPAPLALPRWSATIVEPHIARILERYGIEADALRDPHAIETRIARETLPAPVTRALAELRAAIDALVPAIGAAEAEVGQSPVLVPANVLEGARCALQHRVERLERRYLAAAKRQADAAMRDVATARGALFPNGVRQERALNFIPLLARHGPALLDLMRDGATDHMAAIAGLGKLQSAGSLPAGR